MKQITIKSFTKTIGQPFAIVTKGESTTILINEKDFPATADKIKQLVQEMLFPGEQLSERNVDLLLEGAKTTGNFIDTFHYIEERLYMNEAEGIYNFLKWCSEDPDTRYFGSANIQERYKQFKTNA